MNPSIVLGIGTGRCGLRSLAKLLNQQPETQSSYEEPPLLPWKSCDGDRVVRERFARFRQNGRGRILCDVASFYLPYLEAAMALGRILSARISDAEKEQILGKNFLRLLEEGCD